MTPGANELYLVIVNDGDGSICGRRYDQRCALARVEASPGFRAAMWLRCVQDAARKLHQLFPLEEDGRREFSFADILEAAKEVGEYYARHVAEMDAKP